MKVKTDYLNKRTQFVLFSKAGTIMDSCESMFPIKAEKNVFDVFPLIESVKSNLMDLPEGGEMSLPCINAEYNGKSGVYDYLFYREKDNIIWIITDFTRQYNDLIEVQQVRNEFLIDGEVLEIQNKKIELEKKLRSYEKKEKKRIKKIKKEFIAKFNDEISTPLNGLISAANLIDNHSSDTQNYNSMLLSNVEQIKSIASGMLNTAKRKT